MAISERETVILVADEEALFPANFVYPSDDLFPQESNIREVTNIVANTLSLSEILTEAPVQLGQLYSTKFECQVYLEEDLSGKHIHVYQQNHGIMTTVFGGRIESCKLDRVGTDRQIVAYDYAYYKGQTNVAPWWETYWTGRQTSTLKAVREAMLTYCDLPFEDVELPNDDLVVKKDVSLSSCSMTVMLRMICELNCCFPHVNRNGSVDFIILNTEEEPVDLSDNVEGLNCEFEEYETDEITGVQFYDSDEQLKYTVGTTENAYPISKNIFLYTANTTTLETIGNTILDYLSDFSYTPSKVKMIVSDLSLGLGTRVAVDDKSFYIMENYYSGSQFIEQTVSANGDKTQYSGVKTLNYGALTLNEKIARVVYDLDQFYIEYGEYKTTTDGLIESLDSRVTINSESITSEVSRATGVEKAIFANYKGPYVPTNSNYPAENWTTYSLAKLHENETFFDTTTEKYYRWIVTEG